MKPLSLLISGASIAGPVLAYWLRRYGMEPVVVERSGVTGMGTTLALVGAYVLAGELARHRGDHRAAFAAYEALMRPYVTRTQQLPPGIPRLANPKTRLGIKVFHTVLRSATHPLVTRVLGRVLRPPSDTFQLPDYTSLEPRGVSFPPRAEASP